MNSAILIDRTRLLPLRNRLEQERELVCANIKTHTFRDDAESEREVQDRIDRAEHLIEIATQDALLASEENLLKKIDLALERIDEGTYGSCISCAEDIPFERLKAKPSVSLCLRCQKNKEHEAR